MNLVSWTIKLSVQAFQQLIVIYRLSNFVYDHRVCTSIYGSLSYPFMSQGNIVSILLLHLILYLLELSFTEEHIDSHTYRRKASLYNNIRTYFFLWMSFFKIPFRLPCKLFIITFKELWTKNEIREIIRQN